MITGGKKRRSRQTFEIANDLMLAPMVAMMRLPMMAAEAGGKNPWSSETARAVSEKTEAVTEGMFAAQLSLMQSASRFWPEVFSGKTPSIFSGAAMEQSVQAALKPASRRVRANYKRLTAKS